MMAEHIYSAPAIARKYLHYYFTAGNGKGHGAHSPFLFHFITKILNDTTAYPEYSKVENLRHALLADRREIDITDHGAGSGYNKKVQQRAVAGLARHAAKPKKYGQLLFRMIRAWKPKTILEFGTSLGITTSYLASGNPAAKLITMEGSPSIAKLAKENLNKLNSRDLTVLEGTFDDLLPGVLQENRSFDFVFVDGNHRYDATVRYFQDLLPAMHNDSVIVFDDIHWSKGMEKAWKEIKSHESVRCSIDLFFIGAVFFRKEFMEKQHFTVRF